MNSDEARGIHCARVRLQGDFKIVGRAPMRARRADHRRGGRWVHQRGRAATEENTGENFVGRAPCEVRKLTQKRVLPRVLIDMCGHMAVEVAVRTFRKAKRPMDVEAEPLVALRVHRGLMRNTLPPAGGRHPRDDSWRAWPRV